MSVNMWRELLWLINALCYLQYSVDGRVKHCAPLLLPGNEGRTETLFRDGDILFGGMFAVHEYSATKPCGDHIWKFASVAEMEAMVYAIGLINSDEHLLPNVTLGYVIFDDCNSETTALARAMHFLHTTKDNKILRNASSCGDQFQLYDIVGLIGNRWSSLSIVVSNFLNVLKIPQVSPIASSDLLSNKDKYKYFMRVVPPDRYQAKAIADLVSYFNWTYISTVHSEGAYGSSGVKQVIEILTARGVCVALNKQVSYTTTDKAFDDLITELRQYKNARVVVLFVHGPQSLAFLAAAQRMNAYGEFIFIFSDGLSNIGTASLGDASLGTFLIEQNSAPVDHFKDYFSKLDERGSGGNIWYAKFWEEKFSCSWGSPEPDKACRMNSTVAAEFVSSTALVPLVIDSVYTLAHGLHDFINATCPSAFGNMTAFYQCFDAVQYHKYLLKVRFTGVTGNVEFDEFGDAKGKYLIGQFVRSANKKFRTKNLGFWDKWNENLYMNPELAEWYVKGPTPDPHYKSQKEVPESVCSKKCLPGQFYIQKELPCCWDCRTCRENEVTTANATSCEKCPPFTWPDQTSFTACLPIAPRYLRFHEPVAIGLLLIAALGTVLCLFLFVLYARHRDNRLIKASSRELSCVLLTGATGAYLTVFTLLQKPNELTCQLSIFGFNLSFAVVYAALLTRVNRIYRIFNAGTYGQQRIGLISPTTQLLITAFLISIQVLLTIVTAVFAPPTARKRMPVAAERYVELLCDLSPEGFIAPLSYNFLLILASTFYGFKTRKYPENFNESRYIFVCVCTTIFIWLAFIPSYFVALHGVHKTILLSASLLLNTTVMLLCLYVTKLYAVLYELDDERVHVSSQPSQGTTRSSGMMVLSVPQHSAKHKVHPLVAPSTSAKDRTAVEI